MGLEVAVIICFWEKEAGDVSFLNNGEESATEIMEVFDAIVPKCLIGNAALVSSS